MSQSVWAYEKPLDPRGVRHVISPTYVCGRMGCSISPSKSPSLCRRVRSLCAHHPNAGLVQRSRSASSSNSRAVWCRAVWCIHTYDGDLILVSPPQAVHCVLVLPCSTLLTGVIPGDDEYQYRKLEAAIGYLSGSTWGLVARTYPCKMLLNFGCSLHERPEHLGFPRAALRLLHAH